jgi:enoyl-CoA hydratase
LAVLAAKESVNRSFESGLADGVMFERRLFHALFATEDQKEGMDAFVNKRKAQFRNL